MTEETGRRLESWKEIAAHLGRSVRTAQRWAAERGMPVYRDAGGSSERVFAFAAELEQWRQGGPEPPVSAAAAGPDPDKGVPVTAPDAAVRAEHPTRRRLALVAMLLAGLGLAGSGLVLLRPAPTPDLASYQVAEFTAGSRVDLFDAAGRLVHSLTTPLKLNSYRQNGITYLHLTDLDGDGRKDLLTLDPAGGSLSLLLGEPGGGFNRRSRDLHLRLDFEGKVYDSFKTSNLWVEDLNGDGRPEVVVFQNHTTECFACCRILDAGQDPLLTIWHPGHLHYCRFGDRNRDGRKEIYLSGTFNDSPRSSTPVLLAAEADWSRRGQVLDLIRPGRILPASTPAGITLAYVNLKKDRLNPRVYAWEKARIWQLGTDDGEFKLDVGASPFRVQHANEGLAIGFDTCLRRFFFDHDLACRSADFTPGPAEALGVDTASPAARELLIPLYWNGAAWLSTPCTLPAAAAGDPVAGDGRQEKMIDVGSRKLHGLVYGQGRPAVVLVSGLNSPQTSWDSVVPALAAITTVVTYDRAGVGKSEIGDLPAHGERSAQDLHLLLDSLGVPKPVILVGHSFGGFIVRLFASRYPEDVAGIILEEVQHEDNLTELRAILHGKDLEAYDQMIADMFSESGNPKTEADYRDITREQVRRSQPLPRVPFVILTCSGRAKAMSPIFSPEAIEAMTKLDLELMNRLAALIPRGMQILVGGTGHYIHVDKPQVLIEPTVEMIKEVKAKGKY